MTQLENLKEEFRNILINWISEDHNREYVACEIVSESDKFAIDFAEWLTKSGFFIELMKGSKSTSKILEIFKKEEGL